MSPRSRRTPLALAVLGASLLALLLTAAPAFANPPSLGEIAGPIPGEAFHELKSESVAVNDENGHIYVADSGDGLVYDFTSSSDTTATVWNGSATPAGSFGGGPVADAVDNATGDVYVADATHAVIDKFDQNGNLIESFGDSEPTPNGQLSGLKTPAASFSPASSGTFGIAVDQATGDLYVIDAGHEVIDVFSSSGVYLPAKQIAAAPNVSFSGYADGIAVDDKTGNIFVSDSGSDKVYEFESTGAYLATLDGHETPSGSFGGGYVSVAADNETGDFYVTDTSDQVVDQVEPAGPYSGEQITTTPGGSYGGIAVSQATGDLYVSDGSSQTVKIFAPLAPPLPLKVEKAGSGSGTLSSSPPGISCGPACAFEEHGFEEGSTIILTATRATHSKFVGWTACPHVISTNEFTPSECEVELTAATEVKAEFAPIPQANLEVTVKGPGEITISPFGIACTSGPCAAHFDIEGPESTVTLTVNHNERTAFASWSTIEGAPGTCTGAASPCEVTMSAAVKLEAEFTAIAQEELKVEKTGEGTVTGSQPSGEFTPINCGSTCTAEYNQESTITLIAAAAADNRFEKWGPGACQAKGVDPECVLTMSAAQTAKADFAPTLHTLTLTPTGLGELSSAPSGITGCTEGGGTCTNEFQEGSTVVLTATPNEHDHVTWAGCTKVLSPNECKVKIGESAVAVQAHFSIDKHLLTVAPTGPGSVSANEAPISACTRGGGTCTGEYGETSTVTLTATPAPHYHLETWSGEGCSGIGTCEVTIGTSSAEVKAQFAPNTQTLTVTAAGQGSLRATSGAISKCTEAGGTCAGPYIEAATVVLIATPGPHQAVAWTGCTAMPHSNICEVEIGASETTVKASFAQAIDTLAVTKAGTGQGSITCNGAPCAAAYPDGTALTLTAAAASGSAFAGWSGAGCSGTGPCHLTLEADTAITGTFNAKPPPPVEDKCVVPQLAGRTLAQASSALSAAHCTLGTMTKPKPKKHHKLGPLVVKSSEPAVGATLPAGSKVNLTLGPKPKKKGNK